MGVAHVVDALDSNDQTNLTQLIEPNHRPYIKTQLGLHVHHPVVLAPAATHVRRRPGRHHGVLRRRLIPVMVLMRHGIHGWRLRGGWRRGGVRGEEEGGRGRARDDGRGHGSVVGVRWLHHYVRHANHHRPDHG
jgi:hypothetical protein